MNVQSYRDADHAYLDGERRLASCTEILAGVTLYDNTGPWFRDPKYRMRGDAISRAIRGVFEGTYTEAGTHPEVRDGMRQFRNFLDQTGFEIKACEQAYSCPDLGYGGRLDVAGLFERHGNPTIVEVKFGSVPIMVGCQLAGYELLARTGVRIKLPGDKGRNWLGVALMPHPAPVKLARRCLQLKTDSWKLLDAVRANGKMVSLDSHQWDVGFRSALNIHNLKAQFGVGKGNFEV